MSRKRLTARELSFCGHYICCGNGTEAATRAGYKKYPAKHAQELLSREDISCEIERLCELRTSRLSQLSRVGYERLAFGSIADAVSLLYMDSPSAKELEKMDLFSVAEIRRPKDGSMEIKFFDRLKALEKLSEKSEGEGGAAPFYEAILRGAEALTESKSSRDIYED